MIQMHAPRLLAKNFSCALSSMAVAASATKEEEKEFFPKVEKALGKARLEELAEQMQERFEAAKAEDFRIPLQRNLKEVLAGALKPGHNGHSTRKTARKKPAKRAASSRASS